MSLPFENKTVVITGAGAGIGRALAAGFCADGARVVGFGRQRSTLDDTAARFGHGRMQVVVGDLAKSADVDRLFDSVLAEHGGVDVLINNAAVYPRTGFLDADMGSLEQALAINVLGMARCCHKVLPSMLARGHGRVLNVGSFAWKGRIPNAVAYATTKGAVHALTRAIAAEIDRARHPDVLVNEFLPGVFKTAMSETGADPMTAYPYARTLVQLPPGGPHGEVFLHDQLFEEHVPLRRRILRKLGLG